MTDIIDLNEPLNRPMDNRPIRRNSVAVSGRTAYVSTNNDTGMKFGAMAPAGSKNAAALREICMDVQKRPASTRKAITAPEISETVKTKTYVDADSGRMVRIKERRLTPSRGRAQRPEVQQAEPTITGPGPWFKRETAREVAYHSKSANGEVFVSAPKDSEDAAMDRMSTVRDSTLLYDRIANV